MRFSTFSILTITALTTSVVGQIMYNRAWCVDENGENAIEQSKSTCGAYANNKGGDYCEDCAWGTGDPNIQNGQTCYSAKRDINIDSWDKICQLYRTRGRAN
ncbi:hypothetical protein HYFRA_00013185 [Hymenoscyphus fraxineus]|uniref:Secreted protein n=1 Tax=Hymenoscyphus fraxineus TaxID=746836 RepID=A0A9N9L8A2_9HELO|nr:hypothetical protein HYFRA_00013185 [Hymenoscyphus fraxineus]